MKILEVNNPY